MTLATAAVAADAPNPAHAIAQKFAAPTETAAPQPAKTQAPVQKAGPSAAKPEPAKAEPAKADAAKPEPMKVEAAKAEAPKAERPPLDYEMEMLRQARAEKAAVNAAKSGQTQPSSVATTATVAPAPAAVAQPSPSATPPKAVTAVSPAAAPVTPAPVVAAPAVAAPVAVAPAPAAVSPPAPAKTAEATPAPAAAKAAVEPAKVEPTKSAEPANAPVAASGPTTPATLLLALETSSASAKGATAAASFDPIICLNDTCFVSGGLQADAIQIAKSDAIKLKTSEEASPGSCKGMIACVYRNVAVPAGAQFQLIELGSASHDQARAADLKIDATCKVTEGELGCDEPIATANFKVWVVPEETAKTAGVQAIEDAVADGLPHVDVARTTDK